MSADDESGSPIKDDRLYDPKAINALAKGGQRGIVDTAWVVRGGL